MTLYLSSCICCETPEVSSYVTSHCVTPSLPRVRFDHSATQRVPAGKAWGLQGIWYRCSPLFRLILTSRQLAPTGFNHCPGSTLRVAEITLLPILTSWPWRGSAGKDRWPPNSNLRALPCLPSSVVAARSSLH